MDSKYEKILIYGILAFVFLGILSFWDRDLAVGTIMLIFLSLITFLLIIKNKKYAKNLSLLFLVVLLIHTIAVLFVHYTDFQPFADQGGDFIEYDLNAQEIAKRVGQGNFSLEPSPKSNYAPSSHYYPVIIGYLYAFTVPSMLIGQLVNAWLVAIVVVLAFLIVTEIGGSEKGAFSVGLIIAVYPSLLFFGSLLLKDALVISLALAGLLLTIKLIKNFFWKRFLILYIILAALTHFRFYVGYVVMATFILSLFFLSKTLTLRKRFLYLVVIVVLFGFLPELCANQGYLGTKTFKDFLNPPVITYYREVLYAPVEQPSTSQPPTSQPPTSQPSISENQNVGSSFESKLDFDNPVTFLVNSVKSFIYSLLGPFPWQLKSRRHLFTLLETIPWYFLFFFVIKGITKSVKFNKLVFPLIIFSLMVIGVLALFISNFGIVTRIRIPAFIAFLCLLPFGLKKINEIDVKEKILEMFRRKSQRVLV